MTKLPAPDKSSILSDLSPYIYGTTRLGDDKIPFEERVQLARLAIESVPWFHTSHTYGNALDVLRTALDQDRTQVPKFIVKLIASNMDEMREVIRKNAESLGVDSIALGQLCLGGELAEQFANFGACYQALAEIKEQGLVGRYVVEVFPWTSGMSLQALRNGYAGDIADGYIFYLNPLQRFASNALWDLINKNHEPIIAMRTVAGGNVHRLRDVPGAAWKPYIQERATQIAPIFERSGIESWTEFCIRFSHGFSQVRATVGATSKAENLEEFVTHAQAIQPLPQDIMDEIIQLQYKWSDEVDMHAEHWSM